MEDNSSKVGLNNSGYFLGLATASTSNEHKTSAGKFSSDANQEINGKGVSSKNPSNPFASSSRVLKKSQIGYIISPRSSVCKGNVSKTNPFLDTSNSEIRMASLSNIPDQSDDETDEEEENNNHCFSGIDRLSDLRLKRSHPRFVSRSLPVTPRMNGNCLTTQSGANDIMSPFSSGVGGTSTPLLVSSHLATHLPLDGSFNSMGSLSPSTSQYVTCMSGMVNETSDKTLPSTIDYSSLPLPKEDCFKLSNRRQNISRHMSEPCIHEVTNNHLVSSGKCHSCPQRKSSLKHRRRDCHAEVDQIDSKVDDVDGVETQWQFIRTLIDELNKSRSQTNRLTVELHHSKMETQMLKATLESYTEAGIQPGIIAEMVGQIHAAQKVRDESMMSRIKLANEERDAALVQTQSLLEKLGLSPRADLDTVNIPGFKDYSCFSSHNIRLEEASNFEEELKAIKSVYAKQSHRIKADEDDHNSQELLEELKSKLNDSESSRVQLQDRCSKLERVFGSLGRKMNGLSSAEPLRHFADQESFSISSSGTNASQSLRKGATSDPDTKDSSLDSVESSSVSSGPPKDPPSFTVSSSGSTMTPPSMGSRSESDPPEDSPPQTSYNMSVYRTRNLPGVPIMGPITEL